MNKMQFKVVIALVCLCVCGAVKVSEETVKDHDGETFDVTSVNDEDTDVAIIKRNGKIVEEQISKKDKNYVIIKTEKLCNVEWEEKSPKECHEATSPTDVPDDIKDECEDLEVLYVKTTDCHKEHQLQKRSCIIYYISRYICTYHGYGYHRYRKCYYQKYPVKRCYGYGYHG